MKLLDYNLKCPDCGAIIKGKLRDEVFCEFCGGRFVIRLEKIIDIETDGDIISDSFCSGH
mgnify:CR=1 FL=1